MTTKERKLPDPKFRGGMRSQSLRASEVRDDTDALVCEAILVATNSEREESDSHKNSSTRVNEKYGGEKITKAGETSRREVRRRDLDGK